MEIKNQNKKDLKFISGINRSKSQSKSQSKEYNHSNSNRNIHKNIKKISNNQRFSKLKKKKVLDKLLGKYISEKLNKIKDKNKKNNSTEKDIESKIFSSSSDKSCFHKKNKIKNPKSIKIKKYVTDSSFKINNISEFLLNNNNKKSYLSHIFNHNLNKNKNHKMCPLKTVNNSEFKSLEENHDTNITFFNLSNSNFYNNKKFISKFNDIKISNNNLNIKKCPMLWQIIAFSKKYKKLYENLLKQNEELQKENEELKKQIEDINDEVCILKEEDNLNKELIKENEDKVEELSNYIKKQNKINESRLDDFKLMLFKKDEEIQKLLKELERMDNNKRNIYFKLNNEIENFKEKINKQNEEINKYKEKKELFQNENNFIKNNNIIGNINSKNDINNIKIINNCKNIINKVNDNDKL